MISGKIDDMPDARGFVFDGFPRTRAQADALDKLLEFKNTKIQLVLALEVPEPELVKRMLGRGETSGRSDDTEEVIAKRIKEYHSKTQPVATYYNTQGKLEQVTGIHTIEDTFKMLSRHINKYLLPVA
jgi:adenylate kinase